MGKYIIEQATRTGISHERKGLDNEDRAEVIIHGDRIWMGIFDGVSQGGGGAMASALAGDSMKTILDEEEGSDINECGLVILQRAQEIILKTGAEHPEYGIMQTTAVIACLEQESHKLSWFSIGDSALFVIPKRGKARKLTIEDTDIGEMVALGKMSLKEASKATVGHELNKWLGMPVPPEGICENIRTGATILGHHDSVLVCSDGLYAKVPDIVLADWLRKGKEATSMAKAAVDLGSMDDITVITVVPERFLRCGQVPLGLMLASVVFSFALGFLCGTGVSIKMKDLGNIQRPIMQDTTEVVSRTDSLTIMCEDNETF